MTGPTTIARPPPAAGHRPAAPSTPPAPEAHRLRHSRRTRCLALLLAAALAVVGVKLMSVGWYSHAGVTAFADGRFDDSETAFERLQIANVVESWKAPFGIGDARAANDDLVGAEAAFRTSLRLNPSHCETRYNLAATIESLADDAVGAGTPAAARLGYQDALSIAEGGTCPGTTEVGHRLVELADRVRQKLTRTNGEGATPTFGADAPENDPLPNADSGQSPSGNQQSRIEQRNQTGAVERRDRMENIAADAGSPDRPRW